MNAPWSIPNGGVSKYTDSIGSSRLQSADNEGLCVIVCDVHGRLYPATSLDKELVATDDSVACVWSRQPPQHLDRSFIDGLNVKL